MNWVPGPILAPSPSLNSGTTFTLPGGKRMLFAPGQVWVVLAPESPASYANAARV